ncbi:MAG: polysaccharide biosynthesis C-terminal domain-containing protein [Lachnospiraceae bacterium]|nr:polysaccharide biosynthesis C-terminal domain-containing protein [Lachnospiraceae bacterium]
MSRSVELAKKTFIITLGKISTQFITFLLLPLYTTLLSTEEYGTVDLIMTLVQLLIPIISLMMDQGAFRYLLNCSSEEDKKKTISSAFFILVFLSIFTVISTLFICNTYKIWVVFILLATVFSNLFLQIARGLNRTIDYALGSFFCSAVTIVLNVLCIAFLRMGTIGILAATFAGNLICCLFIFFRLRIIQYISFKHIDKGLVLEELKYSVPLVPNQLSVWVMNSSDRVIITIILGSAANGILAVSHKFPAIYMTFFNIFLLAWHETAAVHYFDEDRDKFFSDMLEKVISIFSTLCLGIIVVLPLVFGWFVNPSYHDAYYNIPIYLIASLLNVVVGLLGVVYVATKNTGEIAKTTIVSAIINIIVNVALIRLIGLYAASISTFVGYLITMIYRIHDTKKYLNIKYNFTQYCKIVVALAVTTVIYYLENKVISIISVPIFIIIAVWTNRNTLKVIVAYAKKKF